MQKTYRYLANNKVTLLADLAGNVTEYRPVYQKTIKAYRGIDNLLYFEIKNHDQKPVSLAGYTPKFIAYDENNVQVLEYTGTVIDDATTKTTTVAESAPDANLEFSTGTGISKGQTVSGVFIKDNTYVSAVVDGVVTLSKSPSGTVPIGSEISFQSKSKKGVFTVNISESDLLNINEQYLKYAVFLTDSTGVRTLTYSNAHFDARGTLFVEGDALPGPLNTTSVTSFTQDSEGGTIYYSDIIDAHPSINGNSALHTASVYTDNYVGTVKVQATLENLVTLNTFWSTETTLTFTGSETEPLPVNFNGVYSFLRFVTDAAPTDKISKILVRN